MRYVLTSEIAVGDRFAKSIFNKDGVLLFNSGVKVDASMITKLKELNLYGTYILDAAEPVPPMTKGEMEFERFQWAQTYMVNEILMETLQNKVSDKLDKLTELIYSYFGNRGDKMIFNQCLRSENDFISKHSLNVAILSTLLAGRMNLDAKETKYLIAASIFHDIGRLLVPREIMQKQDTLTPQEMSTVHSCLLDGFNMLGSNYHYPAGMRRYIIQLSRALMDRLPNYPKNDQTLLTGTKIIQVADIYDTLTAVRSYKSPMSAFSALKIMQKETDKYDSQIIDVLVDCIHILPTGSYVELSNGEQGIVVRENHRKLHRPVVLGMRSNTLYDLSVIDTYNQVKIVDTVFTPDNRQRVEIDVSKFMK